MSKLDDLKRDRLLSRVTGPLSRAMRAGDWTFVVGFVAGRFGVVVSMAQVERWWKRRPGGDPRNRCEDWSDGTFAMWLKNRLGEAGLLVGHPGDNSFGSLFVELHVGFLSVEETPEQLALLRRSDSTPVRKGPDTPGIVRRGTVGPVNRVVARVSHG